ncbi:MAG: phosphoglycerate mutase, partial [Lactobacillus paragasseri]|nr:phosphoglycerate mutase [Lactobacillus paragasseri]
KIEGISNEDIVKVEVPNAEPIVYTFDSDLHIIKKEILH